jgi:hypothetical protein
MNRETGELSHPLMKIAARRCAAAEKADHYEDGCTSAGLYLYNLNLALP